MQQQGNNFYGSIPNQPVRVQVQQVQYPQQTQPVNVQVQQPQVVHVQQQPQPQVVQGQIPVMYSMPVPPQQQYTLSTRDIEKQLNKVNQLTTERMKQLEEEQRRTMMLTQQFNSLVSEARQTNNFDLPQQRQLLHNQIEEAKREYITRSTQAYYHKYNDIVSYEPSNFDFKQLHGYYAYCLMYGQPDEEKKQPVPPVPPKTSDDKTQPPVPPNPIYDQTQPPVPPNPIYDQTQQSVQQVEEKKQMVMYTGPAINVSLGDYIQSKAKFIENTILKEEQDVKLKKVYLDINAFSKLEFETNKMNIKRYMFFIKTQNGETFAFVMDETNNENTATFIQLNPFKKTLNHVTNFVIDYEGIMFYDQSNENQQPSLCVGFDKRIKHYTIFSDIISSDIIIDAALFKF